MSTAHFSDPHPCPHSWNPEDLSAPDDSVTCTSCGTNEQSDFTYEMRFQRSGSFARTVACQDFMSNLNVKRPHGYFPQAPASDYRNVVNDHGEPPIIPVAMAMVDTIRYGEGAAGRRESDLFGSVRSHGIRIGYTPTSLYQASGAPAVEAWKRLHPG
ncbi:hypothetical protein Bbelb_406590 [Branchiostoma belcheri]|nr:hypothetical protein Bbelb_406590 [Branchiostoma belcheri]